MSRRGGFTSSRGGRIAGAASSSSARNGSSNNASAAGSSSVAGANAVAGAGAGAGAPVVGGGGAVSASSSRNAASSIHGAAAIFGGGSGATARQKDPSGRIVEWKSADDKCPVCKTDRYLNPNLRLLVGPCYHKMCESCIDRIFALGPAPCPVCQRTCRKNQFGFQTFEDLKVEREVAIRRTITKKCARSLDKDFDGDLKAYNDYLDKVETVTFNLINGIDEEANWKWVNAQEASHRNSVASHARQTERESEIARQMEELEKEERRLKAERFRAIDEKEKREKEAEDRMLVEMLEKGQIDAQEVQRRRKEGQKRRAKERERSEEEIEQEFAEREQDRLGDLLSSVAAAGSARAGKKRKDIDDGEAGLNDKRRAYGLMGYKPEMLLDFTGPLATLSDARAYLPASLQYAPSNGSADASGLPPAANASVSVLGRIAAKQSADIAKDQLLKMHAGGYDWKMALGRDHQAAFSSLGIKTPELAVHSSTTSSNA